MADGAQDAIIRRDSGAPVVGFGLKELFKSVARNRGLVFELARREIADVHAGQMGGVIWALAHPVLMFMVYAFLFTAVLNVRIGTSGPADYTLYLFAGLAPWLWTQDIMTRSATVMIANVSIVKKVMFPVELLIAKTCAASTFINGILLVLVIFTMVAVRGTIPISILLLVVLIPLHLMLLAGLALLFSSITPYFRDFSEILRVFLSVTMYLLPVIYLPDMVPRSLRFIVTLNPFSSLIWCYQDVFYFGGISHPWAWFGLAMFAGLSLALGTYVFARLKNHLSSVL